MNRCLQILAPPFPQRRTALLTVTADPLVFKFLAVMSYHIHPYEKLIRSCSGQVVFLRKSNGKHRARKSIFKDRVHKSIASTKNKTQKMNTVDQIRKKRVSSDVLKSLNETCLSVLIMARKHEETAHLLFCQESRQTLEEKRLPFKEH